MHYAGATGRLARFAEARGLPVAETQAGKGALAWDHPMNLGAIGVTGTEAANEMAREAYLILAIGSRLSDFTSGSRALLGSEGARLVGLNVAAFDAVKHRALPLVADAERGLEALDEALGDWRADPAWRDRVAPAMADWNAAIDRVTAAGNTLPPSDAQVLGAVNRAAGANGVVVAAAGGLPGELHKLWRASGPGAYHLEYGYSCMGYEIAGGLGVKLAAPTREVYVLLGDGSYLMMNSEIATSVQLGLKLVIVVLDNGGFGCIDRLQRGTGGAPFNNLLASSEGTPPAIDFAGHARSLGAEAEEVDGIGALEAALGRAKAATATYVIAIRTDPGIATEAGGA